ncbi:MAG: 3-deoxy-D-manno-octulosonic acid transferase, partial [Aeromonadaceae bacterium]
YWHLTLVFPFALFPLLLLLEQWSQGREQKLRRYLLWAACYCIAVNLVAAHDSRKFSYEYSFGEQVEHYLQQHPKLQQHTQAGE